MTDVSFADLVLRMLLSLAIVLAIVLGAYAVIRRRQGLGKGGGGLRGGMMPRRAGSKTKGGLLRSASMRSASIIGGRGSSKMPGSRRGLRVVGRVGIGRTTQVVAVQFAEKVFLLGASEQSAPTILAELDMAAWLEATEQPEDAGMRFEPITDRGAQSVGVGAPSAGSPNLLQALRDATVRRG
jgi:flagellar biogenesis protein FliO